MITIHTAHAVIRLYNKMFDGVCPPFVRLTEINRDRIMEVVRKYGRKNVCFVFRFLKSESELCGKDAFRALDLGYIIGFFPVFLYKAYCNKDKKGGDNYGKDCINRFSEDKKSS